MMIYRDRVEDLYKQWKDATQVTSQDVTAQFLVKSKQRDLNATIRVRADVNREREICNFLQTAIVSRVAI